MYKLQKKIEELRIKKEKLLFEKHKNLFLSHIQQLNQIRNDLHDHVEKMSDPSAFTEIIKIADDYFIEVKGLPYVVMNRENIIHLQKLKTSLCLLLEKHFFDESRNINIALKEFEYENFGNHLNDLEELRFFVKQFTNNLSLFIRVSNEVLQIETPSVQSSSISTDFELINSNIAASSPMNLL